MNQSMVEIMFKVGSKHRHWGIFHDDQPYFVHVIIYIFLNYQARADLRAGEELRVSGNIPALGCGNISRAVPMYTSRDMYPLFQTSKGKWSSFLYRNYSKCLTIVFIFLGLT